MPAPDVKVRITAEDNASASLVGISSRFREFRDNSENAGRGLGRIGNLLGDMSREAIGATGPIGRIAEKLIEFGVGGGVFVAFAGGIAAIAILWDKLIDKTKKAREETDKLVDALYKASPAGTHEERVAQLKQLNARIEEISKELDKDANPFRFALKSAKEVAELRNELGKLIYLRDRLLTGGAVELPDLVTTAPKPGKPRGGSRSYFTNTSGGDPTREGASAAAQQAAVDAANAGGASLAMIGYGGESAVSRIDTVADHVRGLASDLKNMGDGAVMAFDTAISGAEAFGVGMGAVKKGLGLYAAVHGAYDEVLAISAFARGLFGDPTQFKAAATAQASAARWFSLAAKYGQGGGSSGYASGNGGGLSSSGFTQQQQAARPKDKEVVIPYGVIAGTTLDPNVQDWIVALINNASATGRDVKFAGMS